MVVGSIEFSSFYGACWVRTVCTFRCGIVVGSVECTGRYMYMYMLRAKCMKVFWKRFFLFFELVKKYEGTIPCSQATTMARNGSLLKSRK